METLTGKKLETANPPIAHIFSSFLFLNCKRGVGNISFRLYIIKDDRF